ncbi:hypothetical protein C8R44DRAFT_746170 [Mycena epipterygia]|nr:hypothetical protein C8R44DRAFT_746170 [Mycena epipterygia]
MRALDLRGCGIPLAETSYLLRNLTYLSIDEVPPDCRFTVVQWLRILQSLPSLEVLSLSECFSRCGKFHRNLPLIPLSELFSVVLEECVDHCSDILNHLVFPPTPCLEITCDPDYDMDINYFCSAGPSGKYLKIDLRRKNSDLWESHRNEMDDVSSVSEGSEFYFTARVPEETIFALTLAIISLLPTSDVVVLCRSVGTQCGSVLVRRVPLRPLALLKIGGASSATFPLSARTVLCILTPSPDSEADGSTFLPALHTLGFVNTTFDVPGIILSLICLLRRRRTNSSPIAKIRMDFCTNVASKIQVLRNAGVGIEWDGNDRFEGEEEALFEPHTMRTRAD